MEHKPMRLLIAEDEEKIRSSLEKHIQSHTVCFDEIYTASNGQAAMDIIFQVRPQIMLLDIQMPIKDGLTVMQEAAQAGVCPRTVILSGHGEFAYAQQALRHGAVDYLLKPCRASDILKRLEALAKQDAASAASAPEPVDDAAQGNALVRRATAYMEQHYPENLSLASVAAAIGISPNYLSTLFTRTLSTRFVDHLNKIRIGRACDYFGDSAIKTYEVAYKVGFRDEKYFSNVFKKYMGISPSTYKKKLAEGNMPQ